MPIPEPESDLAPVYTPRNPKASRYYQCVEAHFETLESEWEDRYERRYGFWRPWVKKVIYRYLDCGDLHCGFARVPFGLNELDRAGLLEEEVDTLLFAGAYPVLYDRRVEAPDYYPSYIQTYIERDVRSIKNIGDPNTFRRFVRLCAGRTGQLLNLSSIGDELGINYKTVSSWISILEASFIVFLLAPHHKNFNKRIVKQPKLYFFDTGLLCSLLDIPSADQLRSHYLRGHIFETFVVADYIKQRFHSGLGSNAYFWRDSTGHEVDMLIEDGTGLRAVEIKSGETLHADLFKGLAFFRNLSGLSSDNCFLIYGGKKDYNREAGRVIGWNHIGRIFA